MATADSDRWVLVKGRAGLGNRIAVMLTGLLYARLTGRRLLMDWRDRVYSHDGSNVFAGLFASPVNGAEVETLDTESVEPAEWRGRLTALELPLKMRRLSGRRWRCIGADVRRLDYDACVVVIEDYHARIGWLRPHFTGDFAHLASMSDQQILRHLITTSVQLHPDIQRRVDEFRRQSLTGPAVGVHVRYTDRTTPLRAVCKALDGLLERRPDLCVFVATDNIAVQELLQDRYPRTVAIPKWFPSAGLTMHLDDKCPDRTAHAVEALTEMYLLGACDHLVGDTTSSFFQVASLLAGVDPQRIVTVGRPMRVPFFRPVTVWRAKRRIRIGAVQARALKLWFGLRRRITGGR